MASKLQSSEVDEVIDWEEETSVQPLSVADGNVLQQASNNFEVLLTGATGFLGSSILHQLVADERLSEIHCVVLRGIYPLAVESPKSNQYTGDLPHKLLGLSESEFNTLSSRVHRIFLNGGTVSFLQAYSSLREPKFESTKTLVSLVASRGIPLHYILSAGVVKFTGLDGLPPVSVSQHEPPSDGSNGYSATKWASEKGSFDFVPVDEVAAGITAALHDVQHVGSRSAPVTFMVADMQFPQPGAFPFTVVFGLSPVFKTDNQSTQSTFYNIIDIFTSPEILNYWALPVTQHLIGNEMQPLHKTASGTIFDYASFGRGALVSVNSYARLIQFTGATPIMLDPSLLPNNGAQEFYSVPCSKVPKLPSLRYQCAAGTPAWEIIPQNYVE
ncbi:male sterility domain-containing protein [Trichoderma barbatum]